MSCFHNDSPVVVFFYPVRAYLASRKYPPYFAGWSEGGDLALRKQKLVPGFLRHSRGFLLSHAVDLQHGRSTDVGERKAD